MTRTTKNTDFWAVEQYADILQIGSDEDMKKVSQPVAGACMCGPVFLSCALPLWCWVWGSRSQGTTLLSLVMTLKQFSWAFV